MADQKPYFKGIPQKPVNDGVARVTPQAKAKVIGKVVDESKKQPPKPIADVVVRQTNPAEYRRREKARLANVTTNVTVKTPYGDAVIPYKGFKALEPDEQTALLAKMRAEVIANEDAKRKPAEKAKPEFNPYQTYAPVDVNAETLKNLQLLESGAMGANPIYSKADQWVQSAQKSNESEPNKVAQFAKSIGLGIAENALHPVSTFANSTGNLFDPNASFEEFIGAAGNAGIAGTSVLPIARGAITAGQVLGKEGATAAVQAGAKTFAREAIPFGENLFKDAPKVNDLVPSSVRQDVKFGQPSSFEEFRKGAKSGNAGDVVKPTVQGWTPKEDPNYPTSFDPIKAKTQSEKPVWAMTQEEFMSQPRSFDQAPRDMTLNEWRSANNKYVPLSDQGMMRYPHGISKTERRRIDARYAKNLEDLNQSAIEYQQLLNKGEIPKVQPSNWIRADGLDLSNQEAAARVFHKREVLKALKEGKSVPQSVIDSIPALKGMKGTDAKDWAQANIEITPVNDLPYMKGQASSAGAEPASGTVTPPKPHFTNGNEPTGMGGAQSVEPPPPSAVVPTPEASPSAGLFSAKPNVIDPKKAETGKPTVVKVFHGSADLRFTESGDWSKPGDVYGGSVFFTDNPKIAKTYADDRRAWDYQNAEPGVIQRYVELKNPKVIDAQGAVWKDTNDAIELARAEGHDGIIIKNVRDAYNSLENPKVNIPATNVVVFDKSRIHKGLDTIDGVSVPPTKPTLETPGVTTSAPMAEAKAAKAPQKVAGVSNNIQLTKVEEGILKESPVGKGMTKQEFQAKVEDAGRRIDAGEVNPSAVADAIENGKALDTNDLAVVQAGNRRLEAVTTKLQDQLDAAIAKGDDATIVSIQKQVDASRAEHLDYLEKVQKGKSEWSNVGRLMAQGMDVDSDTLTGVVANAERIAGKKFKDIDPNIATKLDEIGTQLEDITKKLDAAQAENKRLQKLIEDGKAPGFKRAEIQVRREKAISNIRSKWVENKPEARISSDPFMAGRTLDELQRLAKIAPDVVELAKTYIAEGADAVADILKRIKKDTDVDLTEDDFNLVLSGEYRQFKSPKVEDAVNFEDVNKAFAKMVNDEKLADLRKQARTAPIAQRSRIQKSIRKLEVQIKQQQLPNARAKAQIDADTQRLIEKRESARVQRDDIYAQLKDKRERELHPTKTFLLELVNAPKSVVLSLDNSAPMTHGAFVLGSHPITWLKATSKSIGAFLKEENRVKALAEIRSDPYFDKAVGAGKVKGLAMRDLNDAAPYSGIVGRIPILGKPFKASDRAMEVFGAKVRLELFKSYAKAEESGWLTRFYKANPDYAAIGEAVNTMTGRGTGKAAEGAGKLFGTVATAPTYTVSRFKLAMGTPFFNAAIRKQPVLAARVLADYTKYVGATVTGLVAAQRYGLEVDWDESSSNYLKYKIPGTNVWIDPNGGILQPVRLALQMKTKDPAVTGGFFIAGKTSPLPRSMMNLQAGLRGKKQFGKSYDPATPEGKLNLLFQFAPLSIQNMTEIKNEQNLTAEQKTALAIASFFGANVNVKEGTDKK